MGPGPFEGEIFQYFFKNGAKIQIQKSSNQGQDGIVHRMHSQCEQSYSEFDLGIQPLGAGM